ncbi:MAG: AmmeMemoRadiSam system protein B [Kiritimatiellae bacterium]|nr:AmmeMemoRadiSam system protein B [Kiritimatiellia bacterium]
MKTLRSTLAGAWYPGSEREIRVLSENWEKKHTAEESSAHGRVNVLLLPHAGWAYSGETAWYAVRAVRGATFKRVVILAPSHRAWIENRLVAPESDAVSTPLGELPIDKEWLDRLALVAPVAHNDRIHAAEHSAQIEFPLLQLALAPGFSLVPLIMGVFEPDQMGMCVRALAELLDGETLLVLSSDFTHYGSDFSYTPYGTRGGADVRDRVAAVDAEALAFLERRDADGFVKLMERTGATICGRVPIEMALRAFPEGTALSRLRYATSGDADQDFSRFVCYAAATGCAEWKREKPVVLSEEDRAFLLRVARESVEHAVRTDSPYRADHFSASAPKATLAKMGAFVTLNDKATGALRGCIGEILPMRPLVEAVTARAADSALRDPRFSPVTPRELSGLRVEVSALTPPKPVASWRDIVLGRDGMTLQKNGCFAVFLPQVAPEQGWDLASTLSYLARKAGLPSDAWRTGASFETFQAEVFHES